MALIYKALFPSISTFETPPPGGTGLGLYIVREILVAHGGGVTVESVEGQGTTFVLMFPVPE